MHELRIKVEALEKENEDLARDVICLRSEVNRLNDRLESVLASNEKLIDSIEQLERA